MRLLLPGGRIHLVLRVRYRKTLDWGCNERFLVHHAGDEGGLLYVYPPSCPDISAEIFLRESGYEHFLARGTILSKDAREWRFLDPKDKESCLDLLRRLVADDVDVLRYFSKHAVIAPNGDDCGSIKDYATS
jgi:hypothetical protein